MWDSAQTEGKCEMICTQKLLHMSTCRAGEWTRVVGRGGGVGENEIERERK